MSHLKATKLMIRDVLGIDNLSIEPGEITLISGKNEAGKTSVLHTLDNVLGGGALANITRIKDDSDPEVVLVLEGEAGKYLVQKTEKGTKVRKQVGNSEAYEKVEKPQGWISRLFDKRLSNPLVFVREQNEKKKIEWMLEALDVRIDMGEIKRRINLPLDIKFPDVPEGLTPLNALAYIRKAVFNERTGVNRDKDAKFKSCEQLRRSTPADSKPDHEDEITALNIRTREEENRITAAIVEVKAQANSDEQIIESKAYSEKDALWAEHKEKEKEIMDEARRKIADSEETARGRAGVTVQMAQEDINQIRARKSEQLDKLFNDQKELGGWVAKLEAMREQLNEVIRARTLHEQSNQYEIEGKALQDLSSILTESISALDQYNRELADNLPIKGLSVDNDSIKIDNVPLSQVNTAKQIEVAVQLACLRSKDKPFRWIWIDGIMELDTENFEHLCTAINAQPGVQAFLSKVTDGPLTIEAK